MSSSVPSLCEADYEAIESAVMETARGRWFMGEYARRCRHADTQMLLDAMRRLEGVVRTESVASVDRMRSGLVDMAEAISRTKAEIASLKPEGETGRIEEATEELDSVVSATETATGDILAAAEQIQEIAWTLRERPLEPSHCDSLDALATDIYTACSFQDLTGQRTRKVINVLRFLESRIDAMIDLWGPPETAEARMSEAPAENGLLNGPARPGQGLDQADIDSMMGKDVPAEWPTEAVSLPLVNSTVVPQARVPLAPVPMDDVVWVSSGADNPIEEVDGSIVADTWPDESGAAGEMSLEEAMLALDSDVDVLALPDANPSCEPVIEDTLAELSNMSPQQKIAAFT